MYLPPPPAPANAFFAPGPWRARATYKVACLFLRVLNERVASLGEMTILKNENSTRLKQLLLMCCMEIFILIYPLQRLI